MVVRDRTARILTLAFLFFYALFLHRLLTKYRGIRQASTEDQDFEVQGWERGVSRRAEDYLDLEATFDPWWEKLSLREFEDDRVIRVLVSVISSPENGGRRELVRRRHGEMCTGKSDSFCRMVFSLGDKYTPDTETSFDNSTQIFPTAEIVKAEMAAKGDLLLGDFVDSYNNLTLKSLHALRLFVNSELEFTHFFKVDDNCFFNPLALESLVHNVSAIVGTDFIIGHLWTGTRPLRSKKAAELELDQARFLTPRYLYPEEVFPPYMGSSYLLTRAAAECLLEAAAFEPLFFLEDVYLTGILAEICWSVEGRARRVRDDERRFELSPGEEEEEKEEEEGARNSAGMVLEGRAQHQQPDIIAPPNKPHLPRGQVVMSHLQDGPQWERTISDMWDRAKADLGMQEEE